MAVNFSRRGIAADGSGSGGDACAMDGGQQQQWDATACGKSNGQPPLTGRNVPPEKNDNNTAAQLPRAASYTYLPRYGDQTVFAINGAAKHIVAESDNETVDISPSEDTSGWNTSDDDALQKTPTQQAHDHTTPLHRNSGDGRLQQTESARSSRSTLQSAARDSGASMESDNTISTEATTPASSHRPSLNKSFSRRFSGRSWYPSSASTPSSRSPSPTKVDSIAEQPIAEASNEAEGDLKPLSSDTRRKSFQFRTRSSKLAKEAKAKDSNRELASSGDERAAAVLSRRSTLLRKKSTRAADLPKVAAHDDIGKQTLATPSEAAPAVPQLPISFSTDRLSSLAATSTSNGRPALNPRIPSLEKHHISPLSVTKKRDELWTQFRTLDADFSKFQAKSSALKANVVRSALIPFLQAHSSHPSNKVLRPEDLDRRTSIFNKWWTGLIEMLAGKNNQSISGTDRPVILDGISGIMDRPEWRSTHSPFCPLNERVQVPLGNASRSNTSLTASSSEFLSDSVHHNVRNIFVTNLTSQMAFVVDKMSLRNASASLVTFCGKACAYAFMFVPGMADVLVRLWDLPLDSVRRVLQENGIGKFDSIPEHTCTEIVSNFPPALHQLGFVSLSKYSRKMRTPPSLPLGTAHIEWSGHWTERWSGRESDLFYVFAKHFHVLAVDFLPPGTTKQQRMCAPGLLPIHAQILANIELTINREEHHAQQDLDAAPTPTFDDVLGDPDIHASSLPVPPTNAVRLMAENRLIMLIRDFLSERTADHPLARELFAQSFHDLLQAAARGTSMFNHSACYTLLDFLEEAFVILVRYDDLRTSDAPLVNSGFWQSVFRSMIDSENTMTEIRLYAFLFTVWNAIVGTPGRKRDICLDLLLEPDVFESRFNHWCPMVRAYYMRLLCWRVGRHDEGEDPDLSLLETLQGRLQATWSHYLYLRDKADHENSLRPESHPCLPAPGRRLLIVRTDNIVSPGNSFLTFDGLMKDANIPMAKATAAAVGLAENIDLRPDSSSSAKDSDQEASGKGLFGTLKKMIGGKAKKSSTKDKSFTHALRTTPGNSVPARLTAECAHAENPTRTIAERPKHRNLSFKFSLEFQPGNRPHPQMRLLPPQLPGPAHGLLQAKSDVVTEVTRAVQPRGASIARARYAGRALAEWTVVVGECGSFFDRRLREGVPGRKWVETPTLGVEVFKRPL